MSNAPSYSLPFPGRRPKPAAAMPLPHPWVRPGAAALDPEAADPLLAPLVSALRESFLAVGGRVSKRPNRSTKLIVTCARFGDVISTREALFLRAKAMFKLARHPTVFTLVSASRREIEDMLAVLEVVRDADDEALSRFSFPGIPVTGLPILREEARRVGPIRALARLLQVQVKCLRVGLAVSGQDGQIEGVYLFDLAGGYPFVRAPRLELLADELAARLATAISAREADRHEKMRARIPVDQWERSQAPEAMIEAARELGRRGYLAPPVQLKDFGFLALGQLIAAQYSEGCFATYDPSLGALVATATGSARLVDKRSITRDEISLIAGLKPDRTGARVLRVQGRPLVTPSVEAVELAGIVFGSERFEASGRRLPISIIHLHMGISEYNPETIEYAELAPAFYEFPVSCGTQQLAEGTGHAFARSLVLSRADEPRRLVVLEQPTHGTLMVEVGDPGARPFQRIFDAIDRDDLALTFTVPQGRVEWQAPDERGILHKATRAGLMSEG